MDPRLQVDPHQSEHWRLGAKVKLWKGDILAGEVSKGPTDPAVRGAGGPDPAPPLGAAGARPGRPH